MEFVAQHSGFHLDAEFINQNNQEKELEGGKEITVPEHVKLQI